ncbi:MAG: phosphotransferase [Deltaproteobacteria bacterium]|nr:phosphotransferase [Deltaproteobacteria bacterium]
MKAMILAAGFGTRLLPYTEHTPKPLFTIAGRPLLDRMINALLHAGCKEIIINTHHLHRKIAAFIEENNYPVPIHIRHEPDILGTAGGIKNVEDFWNDDPFFVVNSDVVTDIDLRKVYHFHLSHNSPVTLVLHDDPEFNTVSVNDPGFIIDFHDQGVRTSDGNFKKLTFTGIQVLDPEVLDFIPRKVFSSSIDIYRQMLSKGRKARAFITENDYWKDIGTPGRYREAVIDKMAVEAFRSAFSDTDINGIKQIGLQGDGSDRNWYRLIAGNRLMVMVDHGIRQGRSICEVDSFVAIGHHLYEKGLPVPRIYLYDTFSGCVFLEDLGDINLQRVVRNTGDENEVVSCYKSIIRLLAALSLTGAEQFDVSWTYQTAYYDSDLIREKECRYFVDAFLKGYLGRDVRFEDFEDVFSSLSEKTLEFSVHGFMHRDMQSRNIMVTNDTYYFIDFQGGRLGPIQYDLASLLIDPYVDLPGNIRDVLLDYSVEHLSSIIEIDPDRFRTGFRYCAITRNLQMLGAFGFLSRVKGKTDFEKYIPAAVRTLKHSLSILKDADLSCLKTLVDGL